MADKSRRKADLHVLRVRNWLTSNGYRISEEGKRIAGAKIDFFVYDAKRRYTWVLASALARHATDSLRKQIAYAVIIKFFDPNATIMLVVDSIPGEGVGLALVRVLESLGVEIKEVPNG